MANSFFYNQFGFSLNNTPKSSGDSFFTHRHNQYEVLYIVKGKGALTIENTSYSFSDETLFLIPPTLYHVVRVRPVSDYTRFVVNFDPKLLPSCIEQPTVLQLPVKEKTREIFMRFLLYCNSYPKEWLRPLSLSFITELLLAVSHERDGAKPPASLSPKIVRQAVDFVNLHITEPLTSESIAGALFISRSQLCHAFAQTMKISLMKFVRIKKIYASCDLLQMGYPAQKVSEMMGFSNYCTFYRDFKREFRKSPTEFMQK